MASASGYGSKQKAGSPNNYASQGQNQTYQASASNSALGNTNGLSGGHKKQLFSSRDGKQVTPGPSGPVSQSGSNSRAGFGQSQKFGGTASRTGTGSGAAATNPMAGSQNQFKKPRNSAQAQIFGI